MKVQSNKVFENLKRFVYDASLQVIDILNQLIYEKEYVNYAALNEKLEILENT